MKINDEEFNVLQLNGDIWTTLILKDVPSILKALICTFS